MVRKLDKMVCTFLLKSQFHKTIQFTTTRLTLSSTQLGQWSPEKRTATTGHTPCQDSQCTWSESSTRSWSTFSSPWHSWSTSPPLVLLFPTTWFPVAWASSWRFFSWSSTQPTMRGAWHQRVPSRRGWVCGWTSSLLPRSRCTYFYLHYLQFLLHFSQAMVILEYAYILIQKKSLDFKLAKEVDERKVAQQMKRFNARAMGLDYRASGFFLVSFTLTIMIYSLLCSSSK